MRGLLPREANIIRQQREFLDITQQEVADELELSIQCYQRYEYGDRLIRRMPFEQGLKLCRLLEIDPYDLVFGGSEPT